MKQEAEQMSIFDQDLWSGRTCPEHSARTEEQTSEQFSKRRSKSSAVKPPPIPMFGKGWPPSGCLADVEGKWSVAWRVFDAQFWGVPQRRRRIALVADFGGLAASEILFERESVSGDFEESETAWKRTIRFAETSSDGTGNGDDRPRMILGWCQSAYDEYVLTDKASTLKAGGGNYGGGSETLIQNGNRIRRLTPLECERLQGFPDNWTNIGEWTDSKGKLHKESSDSARYKALGNSIALPSWFYVLSKLSEFCEEKTMASLFDGISGFNVCWARIHGAENCLWSSEIEEFPIAVVKKHFGDEDTGEEGDFEKFFRRDEKENV